MTGRDVTIRPTTGADAPLLESIYRRLTEDDMRLRFMSSTPPHEDWYASWASIAEHGGYGLIALDTDADGREIPVGEAGYALRADGDADLGIAVVPDHRGGLGRRLLDELLRHAGSCGIPNIQADVLRGNRPMRGLLSRRGSVTFEHDGAGTRSAIATDGGIPKWPAKDDRPRVLVEVVSGRWSREAEAEAAGLALAVCQGPDRRHGGCPQLEGGGCSLVDGADAIVVLLDPDHPETDDLIAAHRRAAPAVPIFLRKDSTVDDIVDTIAGDD